MILGAIRIVPPVQPGFAPPVDVKSFRDNWKVVLLGTAVSENAPSHCRLLDVKGCISICAKDSLEIPEAVVGMLCGVEVVTVYTPLLKDQAPEIV
jgi:hypothetical protein